MDSIESLLAELQLIRAWNAMYWEADRHGPIEDHAYTARDIRRNEIAERLRDLAGTGAESEAHESGCLLAHNLNNRLTVILGNCDVMLDAIALGTEHSMR